MKTQVHDDDAQPLDPDPVSAVRPGPNPGPNPGRDLHPDRTSMRAWIMWLAAVTVYFVAVFNRSSLGVAGLDAEHRFGINAAALSTFSMLQVLIYAGMQVPVGLLIDRLGPRRMLISGLSVMCAAQACFAAVPSFGLALAARGLLGCGDAMIFISVLRIVAAWFPARRVPLLTQLTSLTGAAGGIASAWPLAWALRTVGWSGTFLGIAGVGICVLALPALVVRDTPRAGSRILTGRIRRHGSATIPEPAHPNGSATIPEPADPNGSATEPALARPDGSFSVPVPVNPVGPPTIPAPARVRDQMRDAWARPHTRLGLWVHFTTGFPGAVFSLLWGYPFLVQGEGVSSSTASALLTLLICTGMAFSFGFGILLTHRPHQRVPFALAVIGVTVCALATVLLWPGRAPLWLLIVLVCAYATNGAGSMIAFDIARGANRPENLGTASGMVNIGAFVASAVTLQATGFLVDRTGAGHAGSAAAALDGYKTAFCFPFLLLAIGTVQILRLARITGEFTPALAAAPGAGVGDCGA